MIQQTTPSVAGVSVKPSSAYRWESGRGTCQKATQEAPGASGRLEVLQQGIVLRRECKAAARNISNPAPSSSWPPGRSLCPGLTFGSTSYAVTAKGPCTLCPAVLPTSSLRASRRHKLFPPLRYSYEKHARKSGEDLVTEAEEVASSGSNLWHTDRKATGLRSSASKVVQTT